MNQMTLRSLFINTVMLTRITTLHKKENIRTQRRQGKCTRDKRNHMSRARMTHRSRVMASRNGLEAEIRRNIQSITKKPKNSLNIKTG